MSERQCGTCHGRGWLVEYQDSSSPDYMGGMYSFPIPTLRYPCPDCSRESVSVQEGEK